ncbi:hypothetical protein HY638_05560 [Candidatus Woesearchaeota archaeon]|nr:hypothetical protein [Candidatus Woesearchaeota archaeon]
MTEFWDEGVTAKSYGHLIALAKKYKVVVIGGWAVYLFTRMHKSKDIDIVVDYDTLHALKSEYSVEKNDRLKKYEIKTGEFDIDIYLPSYSKLILPVASIMKNTAKVKGFILPRPEALLILKQGAEIDRRGTVKGRKDVIDIMTLLIFSGFDIKIYRKILKEEKLEFLSNEILNEIKGFDKDDLRYVGMNLKEYSDWKKGFLKLWG